MTYEYFTAKAKTRNKNYKKNTTVYGCFSYDNDVVMLVNPHDAKMITFHIEELEELTKQFDVFVIDNQYENDARAYFTMHNLNEDTDDSCIYTE